MTSPMPSTRSPRRRRLLALVAFVFAALVALVAAELVLRAMPAAKPLGELGYAIAGPDGRRTPIDGIGEAIARGLVVPVPGTPPRPRYMFKPGQTFFLCYADQDQLRRDWLDQDGCVSVRINGHGLRERDEITPEKPAGQRRIVCIGDSFTFGWGVPEEVGWVRLLEDDLRPTHGDVRTVNCGAAGTVCIDEYVCGLEQRFHAFGPDAVVLTICLNDLVPSSGLNLLDPVKPSGLRLVDLARGVFGRRAIDLDPGRDWVQELLDLPKSEGEAGGLYNPDRPFEAMWSQGVPQKSLRAAKAFCEPRGIPFLVVLWPFLQGLGPGRHYPFQKLHDLVAADCAAAGIPCLDVLPALAGTPDEDLWVTPADPHANPLAHRLALARIAPFVREHLRP
jgi:hypothetical protein